MEFRIHVPRTLLQVLNQVFELERKVKNSGDSEGLLRHLEKIKQAFLDDETFGLGYEDPLGESFKETRTDVDATISGSSSDNLVIVEVIKPIIRATIRDGGASISRVVQKGIVIVESEKEKTKS